MRKIFILITVLVLGLLTLSKGQVNVKDSLNISMLSLSYSYQTPFKDLAQRFGANSNTGISFLFKTKKNWMLGLNSNFIFGNNVKENTIFDSILTKGSERYFLNGNGEYSDVRIYERGFEIYFTIGKVFPIKGLSKNPNSGILIQSNFGFMQHKIRIEDIDKNVPNLTDDYKKGYDRLTNGFSINGFLGYLYLSNRRLINFYSGVEFSNAWTQNRRSYNFDTMQKDSRQRIDQLLGFKIGWIIPLYKKTPNEFYYN